LQHRAEQLMHTHPRAKSVRPQGVHPGAGLPYHQPVPAEPCSHVLTEPAQGAGPPEAGHAGQAV
ncbi:hypothetical protein HaLaN_26694, partial [Haematococcus lacustris]